MDGNRRLRWAHNIATALRDETDHAYSEVYAPRTRTIMDAYIPHIRHFVTLIEDFSQKPHLLKELPELLNKCIYYLMQHGTYFDLDDLAQLSIQFSEAVYGPEHSSTSASIDVLATLYANQGKYDEAEPLYNR